MIGWLSRLAAGEAEGRTTLCRRTARGEPVPWSRREILTLRRSRPKADGRWRVRINPDLCSDCSACMRVCGQGALHRGEEDRAVVYRLQARGCTGCGDCREVCATHALDITRVETAAEVIEAGRLPVGECSRCHRLTAGLVEGRCMICRQDALRLSGRGLSQR